jgi:hypothetical protein
MSLQRVTHRLLGLLLALVVTASGLLSQFGAKQFSSDQKDLRTDTVLMAASTSQIRASLPAPNPTNDPAPAPVMPETVSFGTCVPVSRPPSALVAARHTTIPPSRGPPTATL